MLDILFDFSKQKHPKEALLFYWQLLVLGALVFLAAGVFQVFGHALFPFLHALEGDWGRGLVRGIAVAEAGFFYLGIMQAKKLYTPVTTAGLLACVALTGWLSGLLGFILPAYLSTLPARQKSALGK